VRTRKPRASTERLEHRIENALLPGRFIAYGAAFSFVRGLEAVESELAGLITSEPREAVDLYDAFLAGCYEKAEEIDDSSGGFGEFIGELCCGEGEGQWE
jgi:hypothetical protein